MVINGVVPVNTPTLNQDFSLSSPSISSGAPSTGLTSGSLANGNAYIASSGGTSAAQGGGSLPTNLTYNSPNTTGGSTSTNNAAADAAAAQNAKIAAYLSSGQDSQLQSGLAEGGAAGANYQGQAGQLYSQLAQGQNTIDQARKNIGLNQIASIRDLMQTIKSGLQGTGVQLGNNNALDSSAAQAAARAYANYGNVKTNAINNGAATQNADQDVAQQNLDIQRSAGLAGLKAFRDNAIQQITTDAQKGLDSLQSTIALLGGDASQVNVSGIQQQILQNAQDKLAAVDGYIQNQVGGVKGLTPDQIAQQAYQLSQQGVTPSGPGLPFQLNNPQTSAPTTQGGADTSLIPLALAPRNDQQTT